MMRHFAILAVLTALGACTPMRWEHPQYGLAATETDMTDCSRSARAEAWHRSFMNSGWSYPGYGRRYRDPFWRDSTFDEWQLRDYCMRNKGYRLTPVPEAS